MHTNLAQLRLELAELRGNLPAIATAAGVSYFTLMGILRGVNQNPTLSTYEGLRRAVDDYKAAAGANA